MDKLASFCQRIDACSKSKNSKIVLAIDPLPRTDLLDFAKMLINLLEEHICAIKLNFHLILPWNQNHDLIRFIYREFREKRRGAR